MTDITLAHVPVNELVHLFVAIRYYICRLVQSLERLDIFSPLSVPQLLLLGYQTFLLALDD